MSEFLDYWSKKIKYNYTMELYSFLYNFSSKQLIIPKVASIDETIDKIVKDRCSVSRFGDGEMLLIGCKNIRFQRASSDLAYRLAEVIQSSNENHLVCVSDMFSNRERYTRRAIRFWRTHFYLYGRLWDHALVEEKQYYNTFITRPYMDFKSKDQSGHWFQSLKRIWNDRDVIFIEGEKTRLGVGNDLFDNVRSITRILCPATNAFDQYDQIKEEAMKQSKDVLFLIALGPTATVLAYDLFREGYQAIDIGHIDVEYEWFRMGATHKVKIASKYVNEAFGGNKVIDVGKDYQNQVISIIK